MGGVGAALKVVTCKEMIRFKQSNTSAHCIINETQSTHIVLSQIYHYGEILDLGERLPR